MADFTYCSTWSGVVYVAFVIDVFSRRIVGWKAARTMHASLVVDALNMAAWTRRGTDLAGLICHHDAGSQYTSIAHTDAVAGLGARASIPDVASKGWAWTELTTKQDLSNHAALALGGSFWAAPDPTLVGGYVDRFPDAIVRMSGWMGDDALDRVVSASSVRPYVPGDSRRWVHWKLSAHHQELYVRLFDGTPAGDWWILLDMDARVQVGMGENSTDELGVILAASLADRGLRARRAVGLVAHGARTDVGRLILADPTDDELTAAMDRALPAPVDHFLAQADLTLMVPGPMTAELAADVAKRIKAGDLARADQHQADGVQATAEAAVAEAESALADAAQQLRTLTGIGPERSSGGVSAPQPVPSAATPTRSYRATLPIPKWRPSGRHLVWPRTRS